MVSHLTDLGVSVPNGFATTADAYHRFIGDTGLAERISGLLDDLDTDDVRTAVRGRPRDPDRGDRAAVPRRPRGRRAGGVRRAGHRLRGRRGAVLRRPFLAPPPRTSPTPPSRGSRRRSSTCAASMPCCWRSARSSPPSTTTGRSPTASTTALSTAQWRLSAGVQRMVRSDLGSSGVLFTMDTESGFTDAVFVTSAYGLGEGVVQGAVNPDEFYVYKPALARRAARGPQARHRGQGHQDGLHRRPDRGSHDGVRRRRPPPTVRSSA